MIRIFKKIKNYLRNEWLVWRMSKLKDKLIIIHTLGKVGSSTVYNTLKKISPYENVFHTHFLSENWLKYKLKQSNHYNSNKVAAEKVFNYIKLNTKHKKFIITLVREPVSREISNFMQNPNDFIEGSMFDYSSEELSLHYLEKLNYDYTLNWFDSEFLEYTGFNVYSKEFNKERGYSIYNHEDFTILIIKLEELNKCFKVAIKEFLGINLELKNLTNQTSKKSTSDIYKALKKSIKFSKNDLNSIYNHKYVKHFYSENEIEEFVIKHSVE